MSNYESNRKFLKDYEVNISEIDKIRCMIHVTAYVHLNIMFFKVILIENN